MRISLKDASWKTKLGVFTSAYLIIGVLLPYARICHGTTFQGQCGGEVETLWLEPEIVITWTVIAVIVYALSYYEYENKPLIGNLKPNLVLILAIGYILIIFAVNTERAAGNFGVGGNYGILVHFAFSIFGLLYITARYILRYVLFTEVD